MKISFSINNWLMFLQDIELKIDIDMKMSEHNNRIS